MNDPGLALQKLLDWIKLTAAHSKGLAVPVSGGSDGALALWLCAQACPGKTRAIHLGNRLRARAWFESIAPVDVLELPLQSIDAEALRWAIIADYSLKHGFWPVGTRNRTEELLRTYSRSSLISTFMPIVGLWKSDVLKLCAYIKVPDEVLASSRRADPACGRPQELADIGIERIDAFLKAKLGLIPDAGLDADELAYLESLYRANEFKATLPHRGPEF